jgi:hypothetical protein
MPTGRRSPLTDLAGLGLLAWAVLLGYVSVPWILSRGLLWDGGISLLGGFLAALHLVAAIGVTRRAGWARRLGLWMAGIGLFGSGVVLLTLAPGVLSGDADAVLSSPPLLVLAVPAGMVLVYGLILLILLRARDEFAHG